MNHLKSIIFNPIILMILLTSPILGKEFSFDQGSEGFRSYGEGKAFWDKDSGGKGKGSLYLSAQWGKTTTFYRERIKLKKGTYRISFLLKMLDVQPAWEGDAFWHFYDNGSGIKSVFRDLSGSTDWSKYSYSFKMPKDGELTLWFRLKVPGQVWIDHLLIKRGSKVLEKNFNRIKSVAYRKKKEKRSVFMEDKFLLDFKKRKGPFKVYKNDWGKLSAHKYYNINLKKIGFENLEGHEFIEFSVLNQEEFSSDIFFVLEDDQSHNYWSKLNYKSTLAPGWNRLSFNLRDWIGERGSHRYKRSLNLKKMKRAFLIIDPDKKKKFKKDFRMSKLKLTKRKTLVFPEGVYAYDFTDWDEHSFRGFKAVTTQTLYRDDLGYGFIRPEFWRIQDSVYTDQLNRYSIGLKKGSFRVKLPPGRYEFLIQFNSLGYWDVPFWKSRSFSCGSKILFKETRSSAQDYLADYLQFEEVELSLDDHPFYTHLEKIFRPFRGECTNEDGYLDFSFEGGASGINLNSLILFKKEDQKKGNSFLKNLKALQKENYDRKIRRINYKDGKSKSRKASVSLVPLSSFLRPTSFLKEDKKEIRFLGPKKGMYFRQLIQLHGGEKGESFKIELHDIVSRKNKKEILLKKNKIKLFRLVNTYLSHDLNHETYFIGGKYFRQINPFEKISVKKDESLYLLLGIPLLENDKGGSFDSTINFSFSENKKRKLPLHLELIEGHLEPLDFEVGFLGLNPLPDSYYRGGGIEKLQKNYRGKLFKLLQERGFTGFSGIPNPVREDQNGEVYLDKSLIKNFCYKIRKFGFSGTLFSYGSIFPKNYLEQNRQGAFIGKELKALIKESGCKDIVFIFSDEPYGYSDRVRKDLNKASSLKSSYPFLSLGGFTQEGKGKLSELNSFFDYPFFMEVPKSPPSRWGLYNLSPLPLDDPRLSFSLKIYLARQKGANYFLDWHMSSYNNYPYFDLDGRESEVAMVYPQSNGELRASLKLELSSVGLQDLKLLLFLDKSFKGNKKYLREKRRILELYQASKLSYLEFKSFINRSLRRISHR